MLPLRNNAADFSLTEPHPRGLEVDFIDQQLLKLVPEISKLEPYKNKSGQFKKIDDEQAMDSQNIADDTKAHFIQILNAYDAEYDKKQNQKQNKRVRANISQTHNWEEVFQELERAQNEYNNPTGLEKVRKFFRKVGDNHKAIMPLVEFIPIGNYTSVLCGGLKFILGAYWAAEEGRDEIFDLINELPEKVQESNEYLQLYYTNTELRVTTQKLYHKILVAIEGIIEWLTRKGICMFLKPLLKQGQYQSLHERIEDVKKSSAALKSTIKLCQHKRLDAIHRTIVGMQTAMADTIGEQTDTAKILNRFLKFLRAQSQQAPWFQNVVMEILRSLQEHSHSGSRKEAYISKAELLRLLAETIKDPKDDTDRILCTGRAMSMKSQSQAEWFMACDEMGKWFRSTDSRALLVNANSSLERISSVSFFCAMLIQSIQFLKSILVASHFCGLHLDFEDELAGGYGLLKHLTTQLVEQWCFGDLSCLDRDLVDDLRYESQHQHISLRALGHLFRTLVISLPPKTPLFVIIDGISFYETHERRHLLASPSCRRPQSRSTSQVGNHIPESPNPPDCPTLGTCRAHNSASRPKLSGDRGGGGPDRCTPVKIIIIVVAHFQPHQRITEYRSNSQITRAFVRLIVAAIVAIAAPRDKYRKLYKTHLGGFLGNLLSIHYCSISPWFILPSFDTRVIIPINFNSNVKMAQNTTPESQKKIVILGGSYGGVSTAHYLLKHAVPHLPDQASYQVILASASSKAMCRPACPRALISDDMFPQEKLFVNIPKQFEQYPEGSFRFIHSTVTELDHTNQTVSINLAIGSTEKIDFHALVIATGTSTPSPLLGLNQDDESLRKNWTAFREALPTAKSIVIAGGGPAGIETAGELGEFLNGRAGWFSSKLENPKIPITVVSGSSNILPALRPVIAKRAEEYLAKVGVTVVKNARVKAVAPDGAGTNSITTKATLTLEDGKTLDADLYIPATGTRPNTSFIHKTLLTADGHVDTNPSTLRVDKAGPRVYAVGDAASYSRPAIHLILSAIPVLCANIKRDLLLASGKDESSIGEDRVFKEDTRETQMVPIGKSKGVGAATGYQLPSFLVWLIKGRDYWLWTTGGLWSGKQWAKES
ncbi:MAG: hypothetical protein M1834_004881 [Cirrosporium novae-zelandiae]|nr:MAG: hypothetical protein M1834_004881 [Cirrosporium novae-zelandiae]